MYPLSPNNLPFNDSTKLATTDFIISITGSKFCIGYIRGLSNLRYEPISYVVISHNWDYV
jgi:hypothetical protein